MKNFKQFLNENLNYKINDNFIYYYIDNKNIGYVEYYYDGTTYSEHISKYHKEFYIAMINVYEEFRGNDYASKIINHIKKYAKQKGATIITLRVDYGMGISERTPDGGLEKLYLKNGFKYQHTKEECAENDTKNLGAMYIII